MNKATVMQLEATLKGHVEAIGRPTTVKGRLKVVDLIQHREGNLIHQEAIRRPW